MKKDNIIFAFAAVASIALIYTIFKRTAQARETATVNRNNAQLLQGIRWQEVVDQFPVSPNYQFDGVYDPLGMYKQGFL